MKKLFQNIPSAGGLKSKIDGLMFAISVLILIADCFKYFKQGYAELTAQNDDAKGNFSGNSTGADRGATYSESNDQLAQPA